MISFRAIGQMMAAFLLVVATLPVSAEDDLEERIRIEEERVKAETEAKTKAEAAAKEQAAAEAKAKADAAAAAKQKPAIAAASDWVAPESKQVTNENFVNAVQTWAQEKGVKIASHGTGQFRIMVLGGASVSGIPALLAKGEQALDGLEAWTGKQNLFRPATIEDATANWMMVMPEGSFDGFVDWTRSRGGKKPDGEDLIKKLKSYGGDRCKMLSDKKFNAHPIMPAHWAVNHSAAVALAAFAAARGGSRAHWLEQGFIAELEILLTDDALPRITTIAYENNDPKMQGSGGWARDVAKLIQDKDKGLIKADYVMSLELIAMSAVNYKQMWSFSQYIRHACGATRGERNKLAELMARLASGQAGATAVDAVLGKTDPALSRAWVAWAVQQK